MVVFKIIFSSQVIVPLVKGSAVPHTTLLEVYAQHLALLYHYMFYLFLLLCGLFSCGTLKHKLHIGEEGVELCQF